MKVHALVGDSGTGKSHRASIIARERGIDYIIDDGLLIRDSKILAGQSAKKAATRIEAVRCAIFDDADHAGAVRQTLGQHRPDAILLLATSRRMANRICGRLTLPEPAHWLDIHDVASTTEIHQALETRRREGKHVIPAPTFEVKKAFSGYLVAPLRLLYRGSGRSRGGNAVIEKSIVRPTFSSLGRFYITDRVVAAIAERACLEHPGIVQAPRIRVETQESGVRVEVELVLQMDVNVYRVLQEVQQNAKAQIEHMTALNVLALDVVARRLDARAGQTERVGGQEHG